MTVFRKKFPKLRGLPKVWPGMAFAFFHRVPGLAGHSVVEIEITEE